MRVGVIDIGSDTIRLLIGEESGQNISIIENLQNALPIGRGTFLKGQISQDTVNQTVGILEKYKEILKQYEAEKVRVVATTAVREARNRDMFLDTIWRKTAMDVEVLNAGDVVFYIDSYLTYSLEKAYPVHEKNLLIAELGGGSLDVSVMRKGFTLMNVGLSLGTMRLKQLLGQLDSSRETATEAVEEYVENECIYLKKTIPRIQIDDIILIDENYFYLQDVLRDKKITSNFFAFTKANAQKVRLELAGKSAEAISHDYSVPLAAAETLEAYAIMLNQLFAVADKNTLYILQTSLSEAILASMLSGLGVSQKYDKTNQLVAVATNLCHRYNLDLNHAKHVAQLSQKFFENLKVPLGLRDADLIYLTLAAYLHDIGIFINNRSHHKHSEYIISSSSLFRLTDDEVKVIACVARYHRQATPNKTHPLYGSLPRDQQLLVQKLSAVLRLANAMDSAHRQKTKDVEFVFSPEGDVTVVAHTASSFLLEQIDFNEKKNLFEEITGNKIRLTVKE